MNSFLTCPADCDDELTLGPIEVVQDCTAYSQRYSQLCGLILMPDGATLPADWTSAADWGDVIDNAITGNAKGRYLVGEGEIGEPEGVEAEYPKRKTRVSSRVYTLEFSVRNLSDVQYEFLRQLQCGWIDFTFWHETVGGRLFGGTTGIEPLGVNVSFLYSGGRDDKEEAVITLTFESDGDPDRADVDGIAEEVASSTTLYTAFGPVAGGDEAFGPTAAGDEVYGFPE